MYAYIVDNKISQLYPSNEKEGKCIKMPDDCYFTPDHDYKYDPDTDSIVVDNNPSGPPVSTQADLDEIQLDSLRGDRNVKLAHTDWTQLPDVPEETRDKYKEYRRQLRDITNSYQNLTEVVWPNEPS